MENTKAWEIVGTGFIFTWQGLERTISIVRDAVQNYETGVHNDVIFLEGTPPSTMRTSPPIKISTKILKISFISENNRHI